MVCISVPFSTQGGYISIAELLEQIGAGGGGGNKVIGRNQSDLGVVTNVWWTSISGIKSINTVSTMSFDLV